MSRANHALLLHMENAPILKQVKSFIDKIKGGN
jgi:hypothetical protein